MRKLEGMRSERALLPRVDYFPIVGFGFLNEKLELEFFKNINVCLFYYSCTYLRSNYFLFSSLIIMLVTKGSVHGPLILFYCKFPSCISGAEQKEGLASDHFSDLSLSKSLWFNSRSYYICPRIRRKAWGQHSPSGEFPSFQFRSCPRCILTGLNFQLGCVLIPVLGVSSFSSSCSFGLFCIPTQ